VLELIPVQLMMEIILELRLGTMLVQMMPGIQLRLVMLGIMMLGMRIPLVLMGGLVVMLPGILLVRLLLEMMWLCCFNCLLK